MIIVGGGPSGSLTALYLLLFRPELAGEILILESKAFPREKICGGGVSGRVGMRLEELGLDLSDLPRVPIAGFAVCFREMRYYPDFGNDRCFVTRRSLFDHLLLRAARERGAEVRHVPAVGAFRERKGLRVLDGAGRIFRCEVLVGADGVNGRSRAWFGVPHARKKTLLLQVEFPLEMDVPDLHDRLVLDFSPPRLGINGYAWFFPSLDEEGRRVVNAGISGGEFDGRAARRLKDAFLTILSEHPEIAARAPSDLRFKAYPERCFSPFQPLATERVVFVGEQLGVDPFNGEGLGICADSAAAAAGVILEALDDGNFSFRGYRRQLFRSPFFPLYLIGTTYWPQSRWRQPCFLFSMSTRRPPAGGLNVIDYYARVFSGSIPGEELYTLRFWRTVLRDAVGIIPEWLATSTPSKR